MIQTWGKDTWQSLHKDTIERLQAEKLRRYLRNVVAPFSAHYGELFRENNFDPDSIRSLADLRRIPFTSKADLLDNMRDFLVLPDRKELARRPSTIVKALLLGSKAVAHALDREFRPLMLTSTTGRSSEPVPFLYTAHDIGVLEVAGERMMRVAGGNTDWRLVNMFPFAPHLAFWQTHYSGTAFGVFMLSTGGGKTMGTEGNIRLIKKTKADVVIGMPTFVYHVLQGAVSEGLELPHLRKIVLGGEKVPAGMRRKLRKLAEQLGAKIDIVVTYGFTEAKMAWVECPVPPGENPSGFHLSADLGIVEIVDPKSGDPVPDGEPGEIVFTPLEARGSVVLRYRTGDCIDGGLVFDRCPYCGRRLPRLVGKISRSSEIKEMQLDKLKGTLVDFNRLEHVLDNSEHVGAWQLELRKVNDDPLEIDQLILHVGKLGAVADDRLREELNQRFANETEVHPNEIVFHSEAEMRRLQGVGTELKEKRVVDNRPRGEGDAAPAEAGREAGGKKSATSKTEPVAAEP
jgi:phenylacetate-CoA ligase